MRTGKELILATKPYAADSPARSWWYIVSTALLLAVTLVGTLWNFNIYCRIACSILTGLLVLRLFVIYHDQQHHAILANSQLAEAFMKLFGIFTMSPSSIWRSSHNHHHNHNSKLRGSHIGSFPIMTSAQYLRCSKAERFKYLFMRHPLTILFGYIFVFAWGMCLYPLLDKPKKHLDCLFAFLLHVSIGVLVTYYFGWTGLLLAQIIPSMIAYAMGSYLFYAQHNFPGVHFNDKFGWTYEKAALDSSSFLKTGRLMGWFTANIGYHHIHHLNARIPFYRLPEVLNAIPELKNPKTTSLNPIDVFHCLRLKVWDVETQQMIGLRNLKRTVASPA